jgi:hypothetical protein
MPMADGLKYKAFLACHLGHPRQIPTRFGKTCPLSTTVFSLREAAHCPSEMPMLGGSNASKEVWT